MEEDAPRLDPRGEGVEDLRLARAPRDGEADLSDPLAALALAGGEAVRDPQPVAVPRGGDGPVAVEHVDAPGETAGRPVVVDRPPGLRVEGERASALARADVERLVPVTVVPRVDPEARVPSGEDGEPRFPVHRPGPVAVAQQRVLEREAHALEEGRDEVEVGADPPDVYRQARTPGRVEKAPGSRTRSPFSGSAVTTIVPSASQPERTTSARVPESARTAIRPKRSGSTGTRSPAR